MFWMDDFQTETGTTVMDSTDISGMVPAKGRAIIRIDDHLDLEGTHHPGSGHVEPQRAPGRRSIS